VLLFAAGFVVLVEKIVSPVVCQIAPYRMDVIGVILGVVMLDQKRGRLYTIVMPDGASLEAPYLTEAAVL
jgi:hypothetical protein